MKSGGYRFAKTTYSENKDRIQSSEYLINIALQNNEKISTAAFTLIEETAKLYNTLPDLKPGMKHRNKTARQLQNSIYSMIRENFFALIYSTKGHAAKVVNQNNVKQYMGTIPKAEHISRIPYNRQNLKEFCETVFEYMEMLQNLGIVPITAGISQKDGYTSLYTQ